MPRRRFIACRACGYLQLGRDDRCVACGRATARATRRAMATGFYLAAVVVAALLGWLKVQNGAAGG